MYDYTSGHLNLVAGAENAAFDPKLGHNIADTPVLIDGTVQNSTDPTSSNTTRRLLAVTAAQAAAGGSWAVVANSGSIAVHFVAFTNNQALIMQRPDIPNPNPYLQVCQQLSWMWLVSTSISNPVKPVLLNNGAIPLAQLEKHWQWTGLPCEMCGCSRKYLAWSACDKDW